MEKSSLTLVFYLWNSSHNNREDQIEAPETGPVPLLSQTKIVNQNRYWVLGAIVETNDLSKTYRTHRCCAPSHPCLCNCSGPWWHETDNVRCQWETIHEHSGSPNSNYWWDVLLFTWVYRHTLWHFTCSYWLHKWMPSNLYQKGESAVSIHLEQIALYIHVLSFTSNNHKGPGSAETLVADGASRGG